MSEIERATGVYWILDGEKRPVRTGDVFEWARCFETMDRIVGKTEIDGVKVSTVFFGVGGLGWDHALPMLFETMIFGGEHDQYQERCSTWEQAEAAHEKACSLVRGNAA